MNKRDKVFEAFAELQAAAVKLSKALGLHGSDSVPVNMTDVYWEGNDSGFSWGESKNDLENGDRYGAEVWGKVRRTKEFTIVYLDDGCGNGHYLAVFDNEKEVK